VRPCSEVCTSHPELFEHNRRRGGSVRYSRACIIIVGESGWDNGPIASCLTAASRGVGIHIKCSYLHGSRDLCASRGSGLSLVRDGLGRGGNRHFVNRKPRARRGFPRVLLLLEDRLGPDGVLSDRRVGSRTNRGSSFLDLEKFVL
jgi:hypothetical protein